MVYFSNERLIGALNIEANRLAALRYAHKAQKHFAGMKKPQHALSFNSTLGSFFLSVLYTAYLYSEQTYVTNAEFSSNILIADRRTYKYR